MGLAAHIPKRFLLHRGDIEDDFTTMKTDWEDKMYVASGEALADLVVAAIGPVETEELELDLNILAIPDFAAGFLYGMIGDNHLTEFQTCMQSSGDLVHYAKNFLSDLE